MQRKVHNVQLLDKLYSMHGITAVMGVFFGGRGRRQARKYSRKYGGISHAHAFWNRILLSS